VLGIINPEVLYPWRIVAPILCDGDERRVWAANEQRKHADAVPWET
jgi:hypothetical protein